MHHNRDIWSARGVSFGDEVDVSRFAHDITFHPGCRITGSQTSIGPGCTIGAEAPVVLENCQLGRKVELKGGYFSGATFFDGVRLGSGAQIRAGTILEEESSGAHTVGLKQTILFPFVTLGSLINFCDVLMAGGTSRSNHSEVGSSYVHFNYTPHQDKATASLVGDVPQGVFLDKQPIFLGGQGGLVGPARINYGSVVAAGAVCRQDLDQENQLHIPERPRPDTRLYEIGRDRSIDRIVKNNLLYIGNIIALKAWYHHVRKTFMCRDAFDHACYEGGLRNIERVLSERIQRFGEFAEKVKGALPGQGMPVGDGEKRIASQSRFVSAWEAMEFELKQSEWAEEAETKETFLSMIESVPVGSAYTETIQSLELKTKRAGQDWLQSIVNEVVGLGSTM